MATFNCVIYHAKTQAEDPAPLQVSSTIEPLRLSSPPDWGMLRRSRRVSIFLYTCEAKSMLGTWATFSGRAFSRYNLKRTRPGRTALEACIYISKAKHSASESQERSNGGAYSPCLPAHYGSVARGARSQASCATKRARHLLRSGSWS